MKFGIVYPNRREYVDPGLAMQAARLAEEFGFEFLLSWDHNMLPNENRMFDAWSLLSYLAAGTDKIRLGTCVTPIPFRPPAILAKVVASLDNLSNGRARGRISATSTYNLFDHLMDAKSYTMSIDEFAKAGCERYAINWRYERGSFLDRTRWFAKEVKSAYD